VRRLILVALPSLRTELDTLSSFYPCPLPERLYAGEVTMVVSDDDPYIGVEEAEGLAETFGAELNILEKAGHINAESGYGEWEWILEKVKR
jgi:predicted alpha/beta hydrolase family esterase